MESTLFGNFVWFGDHLLNLAHVVHFTVEDTRVTVRMADPNLKIEPLDGDNAAPIISMLNDVVEGRAYKVNMTQITNFNMNLSDEDRSPDAVETENDFKP